MYLSFETNQYTNMVTLKGQAESIGILLTARPSEIKEGQSANQSMRIELNT